MQWYKVKEKSAGKYRLLICLWLYKLFGKNSVKLIAFFVALFTYFLNKDIRTYSNKYFTILSKYLNKKELKPCFLNTFKQILSYSFSLVDKMEVFLQKFDPKSVIFESEKEKEKLFNDINKKGVFFICNHIGNIDILRSFFSDKNKSINSDVSIFLQKNHCKIFNEFINNLKINIEKIKIYPVEDIDLSNASILDESLKKGGIAFMAGDRISVKNNKNNKIFSFLNKQIVLPNGVFRFSKLMQSNIYFVSCIKEENKYKVYLDKQTENNIDSLQKNFVLFLEKMVKIAPHQFYHFFDFFVE